MRLSLTLLLGLTAIPAAADASDPSALWTIVSGQCVPHEQTASDPSPCSEVDLSEGAAKGFAVLKDKRGVAQFLLIPTARISGIDDPAILAPGATNYWDAAWQSRYFVEDRLHTPLPRDNVALAINSADGRTQDQLHIHIDCMRPDVRQAIAANLDKIAAVWTPFPVPLAGHRYRSIRIDQETLDGVNPFRILADKDPHAMADMGKQTLVLAGATFAGGNPGFVLLNDQSDPATGDRASGEELQDHTCSGVAR